MIPAVLGDWGLGTGARGEKTRLRSVTASQAVDSCALGRRPIGVKELAQVRPHNNDSELFISRSKRL